VDSAKPWNLAQLSMPNIAEIEGIEINQDGTKVKAILNTSEQESLETFESEEQLEETAPYKTQHPTQHPQEDRGDGPGNDQPGSLPIPLDTPLQSDQQRPPSGADHQRSVIFINDPPSAIWLRRGSEDHVQCESLSTD